MTLTTPGPHSPPPTTNRAEHPPSGRPRLTTIAVIGMGYVGLPTAISLAEAGLHVIGVDIAEPRLAAIRSLDVDLFDEDRARLAELLGGGSIELTTEAAAARRAEAIIVCVPTPVSKQLVPDLGALRAACASVTAHARPGQTIILTSTTYVGSTRDLVTAPLEARGFRVGEDLWVAFSPERIDPGVRGHDPLTTPRVVGGVTRACTDRAVAALAGTCPRLHQVSSPEAAELTKLLENTFRAVNIAMINEFAEIATHLGVAIGEVIDAAASKPYGFMRFTPGPGVGGHCIPCDPHYLLWQLRGDRRQAPLIEAAMNGIAGRPLHVVRRIGEELAAEGKRLAGAWVHLIGVAYKPGVADVRESPALEIIEGLHRQGARVTFSDPLVGSVSLDDGSVLYQLPGRSASADLYLVHTVHPDECLRWLEHQRVVLDATYSDRVPPNRVTV